MYHTSRPPTILISCILFLQFCFLATAQDVPLEENRPRFLMKDKTPIRHMEVTVKGEKRRIPVYDPFKSSQVTIMQAGAEPGFKEQKPGRFDSFDLLSAKTLEASGSTFINRDYLTNSTPYINARNFENYGEFDVESPMRMPFYFYNTRSFTNKGNIYITGNIDFQTYNTKENLFGDFDFDPVMATNFVNERTGIVESKADIGDFNFIRIHAREIINRGLISGAGSITIDLKGENVDLTGGALEMKAGASFDYYDPENGVAPSWGWRAYNNRRGYTVFGDVTQGYHSPSWGISDVYWTELRGSGGPALAPAYAVGSLAGLYTPRFAFTELQATYSIVGGPGLAGRPNGNYITWLGSWTFNGRMEAVFDHYVQEDAFSYNDSLHIVTQMALVRNRTPELFDVDAKIWPISADHNGTWENEIFHDGKVMEIKTIKGLTNSISGGRSIESVYVIDQLANIETSWNGILTNISSVAGTPAGMPDSTVLTRFRPQEFTLGNNFNSAFSDNLYTSSSEGYWLMHVHGARISNIVSRAGISDLPTIDVPGSSKFNQPGSIFIVATNNLNLANARIRGEGGIYMETKHLVSAENVSLDCQNLSFKLGSTNGLLIIEKMLPDYVERLGGTIETFSAAWGGTQLDTEPTITLHNSLAALDANLSLTNEVKVYEATLTATNVILRDNMKIVDKLLVDSETLTVDGLLDFTVRDVEDSYYNTGQYFWNKDVTPSLTHFTNNGTILVGGVVNLGHDMDRGYEVLINNGTIEAYEVWLKSDSIEHTGHIKSQESIYMDAGSINFKEGFLSVTNSLFITADNIKYNKQTNRVTHHLVFDVANSIADVGDNSEVLIEVYEGIELKQKPKFGDLLGSKIRLVATNYVRQANYWPAEDRGATTAGYKNNSAIGHLSLKHAKARFPDDSARILFKDRTSEKHAIYVDYLEFEDYSQLEYDQDGLYFLKTDKNFTIYFAASNLDEEKLDGDLNGRLRWVGQYAGSLSSVPIYIKGLNRTVKINKALRFSKIIDSDDDGTANGYDISPVGDGVPNILNVHLEGDEAMSISIKWLVIPDSRYTIQYKDDMGETQWKTLKEFYYSDNEIKHMDFKDRISNKDKARYYRIKYSG